LGDSHTAPFSVLLKHLVVECRCRAASAIADHHGDIVFSLVVVPPMSFGLRPARPQGPLLDNTGYPDFIELRYGPRAEVRFALLSIRAILRMQGTDRNFGHQGDAQ